MQNLNSDQLRRQLDENNAAMNILTDDNQKIVELLAQRGLKTIEPDNNDVAIHPCVMQLDKLGEWLFRTQFEPKRREEIALTAEELRAGGWWCDRTGGNRGCLRRKKIDYVERLSVDGSYVFYADNSTGDVKEIHRIGNEFYWGAPSDQAN